MKPRKSRSVQAAAAIAVAIVVAAAASSRASGPPQFSAFPAPPTYHGKPSALDTRTAPKQWAAVGAVDKDIIREQMAKGPNFAGTDYLATVGCGTGCEVIFVIDLGSGRIYAAPQPAPNGVLFQSDSRLIILREDNILNLPRTYLVFKDGKFEKLK